MKELIECSSLVTARADQFLTHACPSASRQQLIARLTTLFVNETPVKSSSVVRPRDRIVAAFTNEEEERPLASALPLHILYEDDCVMVIDKPSGVAVHPAKGMPLHETTITQGLCARELQLCAWQAESDYRAGVVHRIDKDTSGVLLLGKTKSAVCDLQAQFQERMVKKQYIAVVYGQMQTKRGEVRGSIGRDSRVRTRFAITPNGKTAHTIYDTMATFDDYSIVRLTPVTGRTHQLRVHLRSLGHPVVGDTRYALNKSRCHPTVRLMLHAHSISFTHPQKHEQLTVSAELPNIFARAQSGMLFI